MTDISDKKKEWKINKESDFMKPKTKILWLLIYE